MQLALRPYVTTGVAIVGASVIAVAPIVPTPTDIQIPNPAVQVDRAVQLAANEIEDAINALAFAGAEVLVSLAKLPAPVVAQLLGTSPAAAELLLAGAALGLSGPLIGGTGAAGAAIQDVVDQLGSGDLAALINALIGAPATLIDGVVNGEFGPNVGPLLGLPPILTVLVGGLINPGNLNPLLGDLVVPGAIPTLQALISQLASALGGADMVNALAVPVESEGQIEGAVNLLLFNLVASPIVTVAGLLGSVLAPVLGEEEAALLPLAALGLLGPLISGPGAVGTAIQDVVDSLGSGDFAGVLSTLIGAPATIIDGVVNGGYGPSLTPLVGDLLFPGIPTSFRPTVLAGGLVNGTDILPPIVLPGTFPTLQRLVAQILGLVGLAAPEPEALTTETTIETRSINSTETSNKRLLTVDLTDGDTTLELSGQVRATGAGDLTENNQPEVTTGGGQVGDLVQPQESTQGTGSGQTAGTTTGLNTQQETTLPNGATDTTDGLKFVPETTASNTGSNSRRGSNPITVAVGSAFNTFGNAVKSVLGGGPKTDAGASQDAGGGSTQDAGTDQN